MNNQIEKTKSFLNLLGKQEVIGSASKDDKMLYSADIDLQENIKSKKDIRELILKKFQNKFKQAKKSNNLFITDFKAGLSPINNLPLKWSYDEILHCYQVIYNHSLYHHMTILMVNY